MKKVLSQSVLISIFCLLTSDFCLLTSVFCLLTSVFYLLTSDFCLLSSDFCILTSVFCLLYSVFCLLYSDFCILTSVFCLLYSVFCLLYSVFCILYSGFYLRCSRYWLLLLLLCGLADVVYGRAGGGGGYGGGHGGGHGGGGHGGDSGGGEFFYWWLQFCLEYPYIGLPITAAFIALIIISKNKSQNAYRGYVIRKGAAVMGDNRRLEAVASLQKNDPSFNEAVFLTRVKSAFVKIQNAWCAQQLDGIRPFISDSIYERFSLQLQEQREMDYRDYMTDLIIDDCVLAQVSIEGRYDAITIRIGGTTKDYRVDMNGKYLEGSREIEPFTEFWTLLRRRGAASQVAHPGLLEGNCPNCGAAIEMNQFANCLHCRALLRSGEYDWVLVEITQACEWQPKIDAIVPGVNALWQRDPDFNLAHLEDCASVMFWRWMMAQRLNKVDPLLKVGAPDFCATFAKQLPTTKNERAYYGECAVGCVETLGILPGPQFDRALVEIRWDGARFIIGADGKAKRVKRDAVCRTLFVLSRKAGVKSAASNGVGSTHCPSCGAPEIVSAAFTCEFCGVALNDGSLNFNLLAAHIWYASEADALRDELRTMQICSATETTPIVEATISLSNNTVFAPNAVTLLAWLIKLARADGFISEDEQQLLSHTAAKYGINDERLKIMLAAADGDLEIREPRDQIEARAWLDALAAMALADGRISNEELALLYNMGERQGMIKADINLLVQKTKMRLYQQARKEIKKSKKATG